MLCTLLPLLMLFPLQLESFLKGLARALQLKELDPMCKHLLVTTVTRLYGGLSSDVGWMGGARESTLRDLAMCVRSSCEITLSAETPVSDCGCLAVSRATSIT